MNISTGRFMTADSFEGRRHDPRTPHKYLYAGGDPVGLTDPSGNETTLVGMMQTFTVMTILAAMSLVTVCAYHWALSNTLDMYGIDYSNVPRTPCMKDPEPRYTLYRGTTAYDAMEAVQTQHIDLNRIIEHQTLSGYEPDRMGVYFTSQLSTAYWFADQASRGQSGRGGGIGIIAATVPERRFRMFAASHGVAVEMPIPNADVSGQTETLIPFAAMPEFETFATYR